MKAGRWKLEVGLNTMLSSLKANEFIAKATRLEKPARLMPAFLEVKCR